MITLCVFIILLCIPIGYVMIGEYKEYPKETFADYLKAILKAIGAGVVTLIVIIVFWIYSLSEWY